VRPAGWPSLEVEVPELGTVVLFAPSLAELRAASRPDDPEVSDEDAATKGTDQNIRVLSMVTGLSEQTLRADLSWRSLTALLVGLLEVSGVTSRERFPA
jgi:hypothetical protein